MGGHDVVGVAERADFGQGNLVPFDEWLGGFYEELGVVSEDTSAPHNAAFAQATNSSLELPEMTKSLMVLHEASAGSTGPEIYRRVRTSAQRLLLGRKDRVYPDEYLGHEDMSEGIVWIHNDADRVRAFREGLAEDLHTSVSQRYVAEMITAMLFLHTLEGSDLRRLDIGCSNNSGNVRLLSGHGFDELQVLGESVDGKKRLVSPEKTQLLNEQFARHASGLLIPRVVGADRVGAAEGNPGHIDPAWYTPDEIADGGMLRLHHELAELAKSNLDAEQLSFKTANVAVVQDVNELLDSVGRRRFDVVSAVASLYQNSPGQLKRIRDNITSRLLAPDGYAYIFDFLDLKYSEEREPYIARTRQWNKMNLLVFGRRPGELRRRSLHRVAWFKGGRARTVAFTSAFARMARGGPFEDVARELSPPERG